MEYIPKNGTSAKDEDKVIILISSTNIYQTKHFPETSVLTYLKKKMNLSEI